MMHCAVKCAGHCSRRKGRHSAPAADVREENIPSACSPSRHTHACTAVTGKDELAALHSLAGGEWDEANEREKSTPSALLTCLDALVIAWPASPMSTSLGPWKRDTCTVRPQLCGGLLPSAPELVCATTASTQVGGRWAPYASIRL